MNFKEQARASIEQLDAEQMEAAQKRVDAILGTQTGPMLTQLPNSFLGSIQGAGMQAATETLHEGSPGIIRPEPVITNGKFAQAQQQPPATRKTRSDKGVPKKPPTDPDEIVLKLTLAEARNAAIACGKFDCHGIADHIQDQIIAQLQRRIDQLQKQK